MQNGMENGKTCNCPHHKMAKVVPIYLVIIGLLLIIQAFGWFIISMMGWEIIIGLFLILMGWKKLMHGCKCCGSKCC